MEGQADGNLNPQQLAPAGQLPGSAQDSGVEEGCDDHDSNGSSSTTSRGGAMSGFRLNSSDREGVTAGEESNLSYGDPPSHPHLVQEEQNVLHSQSLRENGTHSLQGDEMDQEVSAEEPSSVAVGAGSGLPRDSLDAIQPVPNVASKGEIYQLTVLRPRQDCTQFHLLHL